VDIRDLFQEIARIVTILRTPLLNYELKDIHNPTGKHYCSRGRRHSVFFLVGESIRHLNGPKSIGTG